MNRPFISEIPSKRKMISGFAGYNHNKMISDNEFFNMQNMSSDDYPVLSPRGKRGIVRTLTKPNGLFAHNKLCWVDGTDFYYNGALVEGFTLADSAKQIVGMGAYILIWPDKKFYNTADGSFGDLGASFTSSGTVTLTLSKYDGSAYDVYTIQATAPTIPATNTFWCNTDNDTLLQYTGDSAAWLSVEETYTVSASAPSSPASGDYWLDTSTSTHVLKTYTTSWAAVTDAFIEAENEPFCGQDGFMWIDTSSVVHALKQYSRTSSAWISIATTYVKISATGIGAAFSEYDGVTLSGFENTAFNGEFILWGAGDDYIIVAGILDAVSTQTASVTVYRNIPDLDYLTVSDNRVWGCSSANHEIYACKLGDPKNWYSYAATAADSYAVTVGSTGNFTGAVTHLGYVLFFKEDLIHRINGTRPANYQMSEINSRGVQSGSEKSLCIVNETLFYKARNDVCAYTQGLPTAISKALGNVRYKSAVAGAYGPKYYVSMQDADGAWHLFVFDSDKKLWHREDNTHVLYFAAIGGELYFIAADHKLYSVGGNITDYADENAALEDDFEWFAETGDIGLDLPDAKYITKLQLRASIDEGATAAVAVQHDRETAWDEKLRISPTEQYAHSIPLPQRRCEVMRVRIEGAGGFSLYSLTKTTEPGSDA